MVVDEVSHHVITLVGAAAAGFYDDLAAFRIDDRRGDLWVVSARADGSASALHKLQLVSGRTLYTIAAASAGDVRFVDVAVTPGGTVYALDAAGGRVFRVAPGSRTLEIVPHVHIDAPRAFDVVDDRVAFVAADDGVVRIDLSSGRASPVEAKAGLGRVVGVDAAVTGVLFLLRGNGDATELVRCELDRTARSIVATSIVGPALSMGRSGGILYYVAAPGVIRSAHG